MTRPPTIAEGRSILELLHLEQSQENVYVAPYTFPDPYATYGGQLAAQALRAAGLTLTGSHLPHSLHGYFLRPGDASVPTEFTVERDRDGRRFAARRVVGSQLGKIVFTMSASFYAGDVGPSVQRPRAPQVVSPSAAADWHIPRLFSFLGRTAEQQFPHNDIPTRFWARCTEELGEDHLLNACAVAYFADITNGVAHFESDTHRASSSLDYSVWFHRPARAQDWMLLDLVPHTVAHGRGWYTGSVFDDDGTLLASLAQETLYIEGRPDHFALGR